VKKYFDDDEVGPSPSTSHPSFVKLCGEEFFYDCVDEFAPFGSDSGADTLHSLEDWFRKPRPRPVRAFIDELMESWDMTLPDLEATDRRTVEKWLADENLSTWVAEIDQLVIAAALGQYKITGAVDRDVLELALAANAREAIATDWWREHNPNWHHAAAAERAEKKIRSVLERLR
jgi:uncharacterized protein YfeS